MTAQSGMSQPSSPCRTVSWTVSSTALMNAIGSRPVSMPVENVTPVPGRSRLDPEANASEERCVTGPPRRHWVQPPRRRPPIARCRPSWCR